MTISGGLRENILRYVDAARSFPSDVITSIVQSAHNQIFNKTILINALTQLPNKEALDTLVHDYFGDDSAVFVLFVDCDQLKKINDELGHHYGDLYLQKVAERLGKIDGLVFHVHGDEFVIVLDVNRHIDEHGTSEKRSQETDLDAFRSRVTTFVRESVEFAAELKGMGGNVSVDLQISVGCVYSPDSRIETIKERIVQADLEMYKDKQERRTDIIATELDEASGKTEFVDVYHSSGSKADLVRTLTSVLVTNTNDLDQHYNGDVRKNVPPSAYDDLITALEEMSKPAAARYIRGLSQGVPLYPDELLTVGNTGMSVHDLTGLARNIGKQAPQ